LRPQALAAIRSYRLQFRDTSNALARSYDVDLRSDDEARQFAALMLEEQGIYASVEIWDRARLVCAVQVNGTPSC
jgi:hypothetical protein